MTTLEVGQKLWMVPAVRYLGEPRWVTVTKVGRKWASIDIRGYRIDLTTLRIDGATHASPGRCWLSKTAYDDVASADRAWQSLRANMNRWRPDAVTREDIATAARLLGFND